MKTILVAALVAISLAACGSAHNRTEAKSTEKAVAGAVKNDKNTAKLKANAKKCFNAGGSTRRKLRCVGVPRRKWGTLVKCLVNHKPKNVHDTATDAKVFEDCVAAVK